MLSSSRPSQRGTQPARSSTEPSGRHYSTASTPRLTNKGPHARAVSRPTVQADRRRDKQIGARGGRQAGQSLCGSQAVGGTRDGRNVAGAAGRSLPVAVLLRRARGWGAARGRGSNCEGSGGRRSGGRDGGAAAGCR